MLSLECQGFALLPANYRSFSSISVPWLRRDLDLDQVERMPGPVRVAVFRV